MGIPIKHGDPKYLLLPSKVKIRKSRYLRALKDLTKYGEQTVEGFSHRVFSLWVHIFDDLGARARP